MRRKKNWSGHKKDEMVPIVYVCIFDRAYFWVGMNAFHRNNPLRFSLPAVSCCQVIINLIPMISVVVVFSSRDVIFFCFFLFTTWLVAVCISCRSNISSIVFACVRMRKRTIAPEHQTKPANTFICRDVCYVKIRRRHGFLIAIHSLVLDNNRIANQPNEWMERRRKNSSTQVKELRCRHRR